MSESSLSRHIQAALRHHAPRGRETERIGPFLATFSADTDNPYLNYAIPDDDASPSPEHVAALVDAYRRHARKPRLEYIASLAPDVEPALLSAGFEPEGRLPLLTRTSAHEARVDAPDGIELVAPASDAEFHAAASVQWEAYAEKGPVPERVAEGLRRTASSGGVVVLAREETTGEPAGAGLCVAPHEGATELTSIGVRPAFRRRGIAAAMTDWLARASLEQGMQLVFLMAIGEAEAKIYRRAGFEPLSEVLHISLNEERSRS